MASALATTSRHTLACLRIGIASRSLSTTPAAWDGAAEVVGASSALKSGEAQVAALAKAAPTGSFDAETQRGRLRAVAMEHLSDMGSTQTKATSFRPFKARLDPVTARELTISHLLASTAHVGHSLSSLSRASTVFLYGTRHGQAIIDVERYTLPAIRRACKVVKDIVYRDGVVVFLGTAPGTQAAVLQAAKRLGPNGFHVTKERWTPGVITNAPKLLSRAILGDMQAYEKQVDEQRGLRGPVEAATLASLDLKPDLLIVLNPKDNVHAIREATQQGIPTIGIIDTDVDPRLVTYPIPANDESIRTAELMVGLLSKAGEEGAQERRIKADELDKKHRKAMSNARRMGRLATPEE